MEIEVFYRYEHKYIINEDIYEKLRLRAYGVPKADGTVYLEIKKKYMGLVNKRRTPLSLAEAYRFSENGKVPIKSRGLNRQVAGQIAYFLSVYRPVPRLYLSYERTVFFEKGGGDLRISFDSGILSRRDDLFRIVRLARPRGRGSGRGADYVFYSSPGLSKDETYVFSINGEKQSELTVSESFSSNRFPSGGRPESGIAPENNKDGNTANTGSDVTKISILEILKRFFSFGV